MKVRFKLQFLEKLPDGSQREIPPPEGLSRTFETDAESTEQAAYAMDLGIQLHFVLSNTKLPDNIEMRTMVVPVPPNSG